MDSTTFNTFNTDGVELSDTLSDWRLKTNGIIEKLDAVDTTVASVQSGNTLSLLDESVTFGKIELVQPKTLLGNTGSGSASVSEVEIDVTASGLQNSDTTIPTSKAVKDHVADYVDNQLFHGQIIAQNVYRFDDVDDTTTSTTFIAQTSGVYNNMWLAASTVAGALDVVSAENFSRDGTSSIGFFAAEVPARVTITPKYASSLLCIEWHLEGEATHHDSGFLVGRHRSDGAVEVINDAGYEGYNSSVQTGRNNFYWSSFYDRDSESTMKTAVVRYFIPAVDTNERTYSLIFGTGHSGKRYVLNRTAVESTSYAYEYGVSTATIQELYQEA